MELKLTAERREIRHKQELKKLRNHNLIPAIVYGKDIQSLPVVLHYKEFYNVYQETHKHLSFIRLDVDGISYRTLIKDVQIDPVSRQVIHVDFHTVRRGESVVVTVPFKFVGEAPGVKQGGIIESHLREAEVRCVPSNLPEFIEVDISKMGLGDTIHIRDIKVEGVEILSEPDTSVISIITPKILKEKEEKKEEEGTEEKEESKEAKTDKTIK